MDGTTDISYARWPRRALALVIDWGALYLLPFAAFFWLGDWSVGSGWYWAGLSVGITLLIWNLVVRQGSTGYTVGKQVLRIRLVAERDLEPIGPLNSFVRLAMHNIVDQLSLGLGYLWPLWDRKRQTFADKVMRTIVVNVPAPRSEALADEMSSASN